MTLKEGDDLSVVLWQGVAKVLGHLPPNQALLTNPFPDTSLFRSPVWSSDVLPPYINWGETSPFVTQIKGKKFMIRCQHRATISAPGKVKNQNSPPSLLEQPLGFHTGAWPTAGTQHCLC